MGSGRAVTEPREIRKQLKPEVAEAVLSLVDRGWTLFDGGHKFILHCPCGGMTLTVPGTPRSPGFAGRRLLREAQRCPSHPDLTDSLRNRRIGTVSD